ncbi:hypothetical protein C7K25_06295 [Gulosibacter molinativorax]|uniref:Uncharacterized protein n=1 Tax=Gulosibacter molinativorax TaxID=256821 RepID=A0ABT7C792_9MICO|nr:hypothetical protein [Gulosibacter molinativorax]QUY62769.1 Hypotetical protein [Gulosibacter molinativorax]
MSAIGVMSGRPQGSIHFLLSYTCRFSRGEALLKLDNIGCAGIVGVSLRAIPGMPSHQGARIHFLMRYAC